VIFGSTNAGILVLNSIQKFEEKFPEKLNLIAVATDDPTDEKARISAKKRIWCHYSAEEKKEMFDNLRMTVNQIGVPCYTGAVKTPYFHNMLKEWNPDVIIMCCFGQKIDQFTYDFPGYGMFNFHPSDLRNRIGAGAMPFNDTIKSEHSHSVMSLHTVTEEIDAGPIVGTSPPINICLADGSYPSSILTLQEKIPSVCGWMTIDLLKAVIDQKEKGQHHPLHCFITDKSFPTAVKEELLKPAFDDPHADYSIPPHFLIQDIATDGKE